MATHIFPWGTVRSTAKNIVMNFTFGRKFELSNNEADWLVRYIFVANTLGTPRYRLVSRCALFEWDPVKTKPGPKSVLKIIGNKALGMTVLLNYDEATELFGAIDSLRPRTPAPKSKVVQATP